MRKPVVIVLLAVAAVAFALSTGRAEPAPQRVDPARLTKAFFLTVFGLEYGGHVDAHKVKRYVDTVKFFIADHSGTDREADARAFLERLPRSIRHFEGQVVSDPRDANFRVIIVPEADFHEVVARELDADAFAMNARCLVGVNTRGGRIRRSTAVIVADDDFLFTRCLVEEVLQGLGPMNDDDRLAESVFNDRSRLAYFTPLDQALMNVLYHPLIRPGMSGTAVQKTLPKVLRDLGYTG